MIDKDNNKIFLDNFSYHIKDYIFKSVGYVKIEDKEGNVYEFSQLYIDTKNEKFWEQTLNFLGIAKHKNKYKK